MREREIKLLTEDPNFTLPCLDGSDGLHTATATTTELVADYYDTADLRLARAGASLRFRAPEGWTVKLPEDGTGDLLTREELPLGGEPSQPPAGALDLVQAWTRGEPVRVVARLRTKRARTDVHDDAGRKVAEIVDDEVAMFDGAASTRSFREVEIELAPDAPARVAKKLVRRLRDAGAGRAEPVPKIVRALGVAPRRSDRAESLPPPTKRSKADEIINGAIVTSVTRLLRHDAGMRVGADPENLHQARVAVRRLRSDLHTFSPLMDRDWVEPTRAELEWLGALLGSVRDVDVLRELLEAKVARVPVEHRPAAGRLLDRLGACRAHARAELLAGLRSERYLRLLDRLVDTEPTEWIAPDTPARRAADVLPGLVRRPWKKLRRAVRDAGDDPSDAALHAIRIRAKQARYATEAAAPIVGRRARGLAEALAALQDVLGAQHDCVVARKWLHDTAAGGYGEEVFVAGELAMVLQQDERDLRARWPDAWRTARARELRGWF
jgi:CHAD domain-containing protein